MITTNNTKIVFFDIDDTLLDKYKTMPASVNQAISKLKQKGILTAIATGRSIFGIPQVVKALDFDTFVSINGQYVEHHKENVICNPIPAQEVEEFVEWCIEHDIAYGFTGETQCASSEDTDRVNLAVRPIYPQCLIDKDFHKTNDVYQIWAFTTDPIETFFPYDKFSHFKLLRWHPHGLDVLPVEASKARGVEAILKILNIHPEEAIAFGDGLNDVEMFQYVGLPIAMGHSHPELLKHAKYQTKKVEEDGIYHALQTLKLID